MSWYSLVHLHMPPIHAFAYATYILNMQIVPAWKNIHLWMQLPDASSGM